MCIEISSDGGGGMVSLVLVVVLVGRGGGVEALGVHRLGGTRDKGQGTRDQCERHEGPVRVVRAQQQ